MTDIHYSYTATEAPKQLGIPMNLMKRMNADIKASTLSTLPSMESIFSEAQDNVENILRTAVYPRFVKYQMTNSASKALSTDRTKYQGLGDCFCLTDPNKADNPILFASDGFVAVTGYSRPEVVPRNCRFLQGTYTDRTATRRLRASIEAREETVELLLNYKKTGEPFWNLLYVGKRPCICFMLLACSIRLTSGLAPLFDAEGNLKFFIGGQINCSTTIRSNTDVLKILSMSDDPEDDKEAAQSVRSLKSNKRSFFKFSRKERYVILEWVLPTQDFIFPIVGHILEAAEASVPRLRSTYMIGRDLVWCHEINTSSPFNLLFRPVSRPHPMLKHGKFTISFYSLGLSSSFKKRADSKNLISIPQLPSSTKRVEVRGDGMEQGLLKQIEKMNFRTQMEVFYTAYSKVRLFYFPTFSSRLSLVLTSCST